MTTRNPMVVDLVLGMAIRVNTKMAKMMDMMNTMMTVMTDMNTIMTGSSALKTYSKHMARV